MRTLVQSRADRVDVVLRSDVAPLYPARVGISSADVIVAIKRAGELAWSAKVIRADDWTDVGHGSYLLGLNETDTDVLGPLMVRVEGSAVLEPTLVPTLVELQIAPPSAFAAGRSTVPMTILVGQVIGLDGRPIAGAVVAATLLQAPMLLDGLAIAGDAVAVEADEHGSFELRLVTGATVDVSIPAARWRRTLVVPPSLAPHTPVRLFSVA